MAITACLKGIKYTLAINEFAEDSLVAVEVASRAESDGEFRTARVLSVIRKGKLTTFVMPQSEVLVLKAHAECTDILLSKATA